MGSLDEDGGPPRCLDGADAAGATDTVFCRPGHDLVVKPSADAPRRRSSTYLLARIVSSLSKTLIPSVLMPL